MVVGLAEYQSRFLARTEVSGDCLLWKSGANSSGYGTAHFPRSWGMVPETTSAHRVAYMIFRGPVREGQDVCHTCDVRRCVNPRHLFLGSRKDNMRDAMNKGRCRFFLKPGDEHPFRVLTPEVVDRARELRRTGLRVCDVATELGIGYGSAQRACLS